MRGPSYRFRRLLAIRRDERATEREATDVMANHLVKSAIAALAAMPGVCAAGASMSIGFQAPQTVTARQIDELHTVVLWICIVIAIIVFGIMFYSIVRHRRSTGREAKQFDENKPLQVVWTVIPCLIV